MREFSKRFTKPNEMDMKKIPKARMEDFERRQQREREKHKRQQVQSVGREHALFPEPRRMNPCEGDDDIAAKLGDHSKAIEFMNCDAVGIACGVPLSTNNAVLAGLIPTSASSSSAAGGNSVSSVSISATSSSQRLLAGLPGSQPPQQSSQSTHHFQQQPQPQSRQLPYLKQADNKPPYNGRGGYPGQPVKNDLRSSSGMAPPKGPPPLLPQQTLTSNSNNNSNSNSSTASSALLPPPLLPNGYLGPPKSTAPMHNGRFSKPLPKSIINKIISEVDQTYRAPEQITKIAATPHTTIGEYNLNGPNRHKYSVEPIQPILGSPPSGAELLQSAVPVPITPISALPPTPNPLILSNAGPVASAAAPTTMTTTTAVAATLNTVATTTALRPGLPVPKETLKPLLAEKVAPTLQKHNSTLENDLELSESDDDRKKQSRSMRNSSDSSQSDSSESGSEESLKSDHQAMRPLHQPAATQPQHVLHTHQSLQHQQQSSLSAGRLVTSSLNKSVNDKKKLIESNTAVRSNIYLSSNTLGSAGSSSSGPSSTSSSNKTPSPSDSNKWNLSRYFNRIPAQALNETPPPANSLLVNSINVSMDEPTLLPGGAQIIPEATQPQPNPTIVKHEAATYGTAKKYTTRSEDDDVENSDVRRNFDARGVNSNTSTGVGKSTISGGVPTLLNEIKKESDMLYPNSMLKANTVGSTQAQTHITSSQQQQSQVPLLHAAEFVAIPTSQIKHEVSSAAAVPSTAPMSLAGGTTTVTPYNSGSTSGSVRKHTPASPCIRNGIATAISADKLSTDEFSRISRLSAHSSDGQTTNSSDDDDINPTPTVRPTVPTLGPGGTLKIPGVPAAITALPPSPPQPLTAAPTLPNAITVLPINPLPQPAAVRRRKKPRTSAATVNTQLDTSDEEEASPATFATSGVTVSPAALRAAAGPGGKLYAEPLKAAKKGPGRPRKVTASDATSNATTVATAKGPTLTAKKDVVNSGATASKKVTTRRKVSRQNSTSTSVPTTTTKAQSQMSQPVVQPLQHVPTIDSSSSSSSSYSSKSSSSSSSDTEGADGIGSGSSSDDDDEDTTASVTNRNPTARPTAATLTAPGAATAVIAPATTNPLPVTTSRIIVQRNKRKSSHDDAIATAAAVASAGKPSAAPKAANSSKRRRTMPQYAEEDDEEDDDDDDDSSDSGSSSDDSSVDNYPAPVTNTNTTTITTATAVSGSTSASNSHRSQTQQSPYKVPVAPAPVSSSSSSSGSVSTSSSSSSSGGEHSDMERSGVTSTRVKGKNVKCAGKSAAGGSTGSSATRLRRDKPKASDKNKKDTLTRIFNPKEGGAKKQGQVLVIDQSSGEQNGEQQQQQQQQQPQQKLISSNTTGYRTATTVTSALVSTQENVATAAVLGQSPRLTPGHMKSPRALPQLTVTTSAHRTPDRNGRNSAERKVQHPRIKTPSRTPTRTPPATRTPTPTPAALLAAPTALPIHAIAAVAFSHINGSNNNTAISGAATSLICKVDLTRLRRIAPEWHANTYRLYSAGAGTSASLRYAHHEAILNADLQATAARLTAIGSSGSGTPHSGGNRTPTTPHAPPDRELSRSRESLVGIGLTVGGSGKQRLSSYAVHSNGRGSSRSTDGGGSGNTTPKEQPQVTANGYALAAGAHALSTGNNSPSTKQLLKHEQQIKHEPGAELEGATKLVPTKGDVYCSETKFKTGGAVKQELLLLKHDCAEKQLNNDDETAASPTSKHLHAIDGTDTKSQRRKRSASSSPYKEKKRKKDKYAKDGKDQGTLMGMTTTPTVVALAGKDKDIGKPIATVGAIERDIGTGATGPIGGHGGANDTNRRAVAIIPPLGMANNGQIEKDHQLMDNRQLPHTNHDRLHVARQMQQQQQLANASPAHLQTGNNIMPIGDGTPVGMLPSASSAVPLAPPPQVIYRSYFERDDDGLCSDISKNSKFLQEAVNRKHAADKEQNLFNQVTLYLEAVIYFLLSSAGLEQHRSSEESSWVMYKDTLNLIKFISSKFKHLQVSSSANELHEPHHKVAILSLRCQSLISLKLYKMKRHYCRGIINLCMELFKSGRSEILNGNTPSSNSPSNSVCSQGSGSNTPPGRGMRQDMHSALSQQNLYFNYLANCHDLWDQADRLVRQGNHTDFFIALDHENGPLTLHSSMYDLFRYVQSGLKKLKSTNITPTTNSSGVTTTVTTNSSGNAPLAGSEPTAATMNNNINATTMQQQQ